MIRLMDYGLWIMDYGLNVDWKHLTEKRSQTVVSRVVNFEAVREFNRRCTASNSKNSVKNLPILVNQRKTVPEIVI